MVEKVKSHDIEDNDDDFNRAGNKKSRFGFNTGKTLRRHGK